MRKIIRAYTDTRPAPLALTDSRGEGVPIESITINNDDRSITKKQLEILYWHIEAFTLELETVQTLFNAEVRKEKCQAYTLPAALASTILGFIALVVWLAVVFTPKAFHESKSANGSNELTQDQGGAVSGLGLVGIAILILVIAFIYTCSKARKREEAEITYADNLGSRLQKLQQQMAIHSDLEIKNYEAAAKSPKALEVQAAEPKGAEILGMNTFTYSEFSAALAELRQKARLHLVDYTQEVLAIDAIANGGQYRQLLAAGPDAKQQAGPGAGKIIKMANSKLPPSLISKCFDALITDIKSTGVAIKIEEMDSKASATIAPEL